MQNLRPDTRFHAQPPLVRRRTNRVKEGTREDKRQLGRWGQTRQVCASDTQHDEHCHP
jgi:hypothetical protein